MNNRIKTLSDCLASKLALNEKAVKKWVKSNIYNEQQLEIINRQVWNNDIYLPTLVNSIIENTNYRISIY